MGRDPAGTTPHVLLEPVPVLSNTTWISHRQSVGVEAGRPTHNSNNNITIISSSSSNGYVPTVVAVSSDPNIWNAMSERVDTKEKPYICHCGSAFSRRDLLTRHQRISHETASSTSPDAPPSDEIQHAAADSDRSVASATTPLSDVSVQHWIPQPRYLDQTQVMVDSHYATSPPAYHQHISGHEFFENTPNMPGFNDFKDINSFVDHGSMPMQWNSYQYEPGMEQDFVDPALQGFIADPSPYIVHAHHHHPETYNH
ncbi:hypothetical protein DL771_005169 [Monosporascus sp. 5C6A]|nr:hypothetical protein DL771_005169 [Monosporascus sp. 5C6A]